MISIHLLDQIKIIWKKVKAFFHCIINLLFCFVDSLLSFAVLENHFIQGDQTKCRQMFNEI